MNEIKKEFGVTGGCGAIVRAMAAHKNVEIQNACLAAVLQLSTKSLYRI
jgi:hypothetical protein